MAAASHESPSATRAFTYLFEAFKGNWLRFLALAFVVQLLVFDPDPVDLSQLRGEPAPDPLEGFAGNLVRLGLTILLTPLLSGFIQIASWCTLKGTCIPTGEAMRTVLRNYFKLLFAMIIVGLLMLVAMLPGALMFGLAFAMSGLGELVVGLVLVLAVTIGAIPVIYMIIRTVVVPTAVLAESLGPSEAVSRSFELTKGSAVTVFLYLLLNFGVMIPVLVLPGFVAGLILIQSPFMGAVIVGGLTVVNTVWTYLIPAGMYTNLVRAKEGMLQGELSEVFS